MPAASMLAQIADAVVTELNAATLSQPFTAQRFYLPVFDLGEMKDLHVSVVPKGVTVQPAGRTLLQHDYSIDVAVQKKAAPDDTSTIDGLMVLVEEIAAFFKLRSLTGIPGPGAWVKTEHAPVYSPEHMEQYRQFTSVITLTFRVIQ